MIASRLPPLSIIDDVAVNRQILKFQSLQAFSGRLLTASSRMEQVERWAFDDLVLNSAGDPVGINDERGTGEERMQVLVKLQSSLHSKEGAAYMDSGLYEDQVDIPLIHLLANIKTRRFLVIAYWVERKHPAFMIHLLSKILKESEDAKNIQAHILRSRLDRLNRLNIIQTIFSDESVNQVNAVLNAMKVKS